MTISTLIPNRASILAAAIGLAPLTLGNNLNAQAVGGGSLQLVTTASLTRLSDNSYQAVVTVSNLGIGTARNVWLSEAALGAANGTPAALPLADIPAGRSADATISFGPNAGAPGAQVIEKYAGTYSGGTFGGTLRAALPQSAQVPPTVTATVDLSQPGSPIPQHFMGFSMDSTVVDTYVGTANTANPALVNLIGNFTPYNGVPSLRPASIPASSTSSSLSPRFLTALTKLEDATHAPLIVTIGAGNYNPTYAANVAASVTGAISSANGLQFELGNEPDQLARQGHRPSTYNFSDYLSEYQGYVNAVAPYVSGKFAAGMAAGSTTWDTANASPFLQAESNSLGVYTSHEYPLSACQGTSSITIAHLLSDNIANAFYRRFQPLVAAAMPYGVPVRAGEMNSVSCSGVSGVSNTFASSLWVLDSLFELEKAGAAGMNLHTGSTTSGVADLPYNAFYVNGSTIDVRPVYYGMLMFAQAIQHGAAPVPVTTVLNGSQNVKVWGTLDSNRQARIVVIEKDVDSGSQTVAIDLGSAARMIGKLTSLRTTSTQGVAATDQIFIDGQTFDGTTDGHLTGQPIRASVAPQNGIYTITVPDGSAVMLTVQF